MDAPAPPEFDADALEFLHELVDEEIMAELAQDVSSSHAHVNHHDLSLLSRPLSSDNATGTLSPALIQSTAALEISPLDFFPPSDDENVSTTSSGSASAATATGSTTTTTLKTKRKKPNRSANYDPNRARNMRRHELVYLREQVAEMEQELTRLRDTTTTLVAVSSLDAHEHVMDALTAPVAPWLLPPRLDEGDAATTGALVADHQQQQQLGASIGATVWEGIAARQRSERKRAERENERLKIVLETQLKIAKSLEQLLHKRTTMHCLAEYDFSRLPRVFTRTPNAPDTAIFQSLLEQVHDCYLQADQHFEDFGIGASETSCHDARIRYADAARETGVNMDIYVNHVLPFPVHAAGKAAWHYFSHYKNQLPHRLYYERVNENMGFPEDTIVENSGLDVQVNNTKAIFNLKQVIRRYVEHDRVVIAYSAICQPVEFANKPLWGFDFREWGCMVLKKPTTLDADGYTVLKSCYFITPNFHHNAGASRADGDDDDDDNTSSSSGIVDVREERDTMIGDLTRFVLNSTASTMGAWLQMIENILVIEQASTTAPPR